MSEHPVADIAAARAHMHRDAQWLARLARSYAEPVDDDSHTALDWRDGAMVLSTPLSLHGQDAMQLHGAYDLITRRVWIGRGGSQSLGSDNDGLALDGQTDDELEATFRDAMAAHGADPNCFEMSLPYDDEVPPMPPEPPDSAATAALANLFANAHAALTTVAAGQSGASPVRIWPHHFDIATLIAVDAPTGHADRPARTIGVGMSPGDASSPEPYVYIAPWPAPPSERLATTPATPPAGLGWHTVGYTALVGPAFPMMGGADGPAGAKRTLDAAIRTCRNLLDEKAAP